MASVRLNKHTTDAVADTATTVNNNSEPDKEVKDIKEDKEAAKLALEAEAKIKANVKRSLFDHEVRALIKQAQDTIISKYPDETIRELKPPVELLSLNRYNTIYSSMDPAEHYRYFETIYNRKRLDILQSLKGEAAKGDRHIDDRWLRSGNITIQFGEGIKAASREIEEKRKLVRLMLSDVYLIACDLQRQAEEAMSALAEINPDVDAKDLIRTNILMLHLMRIFYHLNDGADKKIIGDIVSYLEDELGVSKRTVNANGTATMPDANNVAAQAINATAGSGGLSSLFTMATSMMEKFGMKPPPGLKPPTEAEITTVMNNVFTNPATQNVLQSVVSGLNGTQDFGAAIQRAVTTVTDPATLAAIQGTVVNAQQTLNPNGVAMPTASTMSTGPTIPANLSVPQNFEVPFKE